MTSLTAAWLPAPGPWWTSADPLAWPSGVEGSAGDQGLGWLWGGLCTWIPVGEYAWRPALLAVLLAIGVAMACTRLACVLFRGPGGRAAAVVGGTLSGVSLLLWLHTAGPGAPETPIPGHLDALAFTLLATMATTTALAARDGDGRRVSAGWDAVAIAALAIPFDVRGGLALAALTVAISAASWLRDRRRRQPPAASAGRRTGLEWAMTFAIVLAGSFLLTRAIHPGSLPDPGSVGLSLASVSSLTAEFVDPRLLYPALAFLAELVFPLRWPGAGAFAALTALALLVSAPTGSGPGSSSPALAPWAATLVLVAVSGWIWLAGSLITQRPVVARLLAAGTAIPIVAAGTTRARPLLEPTGPALLAPSRPEHSLVRLVRRALIAPGDVVLVHDTWLRRHLSNARLVEGQRPDIQILAPAQLTSVDLGMRTLEWAREGRRVLSDSYTLGGEWGAEWAIDGGPLFWFVGEHPGLEAEFTDVLAHTPRGDDPSLTLAERRRWNRFHIERARFRRSLGHAEEAIAALPLGTELRDELRARVLMAESHRIPTIATTELPAEAESPPVAAGMLAEAGDLLYALGDPGTGAALLSRAGELGYAGALGALARWQLRAGETQAARATLRVIAQHPELRPHALELIGWLLSRKRVIEATALRDELTPSPTAAALAPDELGARLAVLSALAQTPRPTLR